MYSYVYEKRKRFSLFSLALNMVCDSGLPAVDQSIWDGGEDLGLPENPFQS